MLEFLRQSSAEAVHADRGNFRQFLSTQIAFLFVAPVVLQLIGRFTVETYFVLAFVWFLCMSEVLAPQTTDEAWWQRIQWLKIGGALVFAYLLIQYVMAVLQ